MKYTFLCPTHLSPYHLIKPCAQTSCYDITSGHCYWCCYFSGYIAPVTDWSKQRWTQDHISRTAEGLCCIRKIPRLGKAFVHAVTQKKTLMNILRGFEVQYTLRVCIVQLLKWGDPSDETTKTEVPCHNSYSTMKSSACSKTINRQAKPKLGRPFPGNGDISTWRHRCQARR